MIYINHLFMPGQTIEAAIKKATRHDMPKEEVLQYVKAFNELNNYPVVRPGQTYKIPTMIPLVDNEGSDLD